MKRFFCLTCQRIRRVRRLPYNVVTAPSTVFGVQLAGDCDMHRQDVSRQSMIKSNRPISTKTKVIKVKPVPVAAKSGKRGK